MDETHRNYLRDLGYLIREAAVDAKRQASATRGSEGGAFEVGRLQAYHEVVSLMLSQATSFKLAPEDLSLEDFAPDSDLLGDDG